MATHYVDWEGAAGSGNGSSFANRSLKVSTLSVSAGDEVRIKESEPAVSLGSCYIKKGWGAPYNARSTQSLSLSTTEGQSYINYSNTGFKTGDIIFVAKHRENGAAAGKCIDGIHEVTVDASDDSKIYLNEFTASATESNSAAFYFSNICGACVKTPAVITQEIACSDVDRTAWTASTDVTAEIKYNGYSAWSRLDWTMPTGADKITIAAGFGTGKAAYKQLPSALNLSGYQQVSVHVRQSSGSFNPSGTSPYVSIRLCTDTSGDTSVHTIPLNLRQADTNCFQPITVDLGTNLNSSIQSVALYVDGDVGAMTFHLENIIASKEKGAANSVTLSSVVGLNSDTYPQWWPVDKIINKASSSIIFLCNNGRANGFMCQSYYSGGHASLYWPVTNGWVNSNTLYAIEPIKPSAGWNTNSSNNWDDNSINAGTNGNDIVISGGWNKSDMTSKTGKTFFDGCNHQGRGFYVNNYAYHDISNIYFIRVYTGLYISNGIGAKYHKIGALECSNRAIEMNGSQPLLKFIVDFAQSFDNYAVYMNGDQTSSTGQSSADFKIMSACACKNRGIYSYGMKGWHFDYINIEHNTDDGWFMDGQCVNNTFERIDAGYTTGTSYAGFRLYGSAGTSTGNIITNLYTKGSYYGLSLDGSPDMTVKNYIHSKTDASNQASNGNIQGTTPGQYSIYVYNSSGHNIEDGSVESYVYINKGNIKIKSLDLPSSGTQVQVQSGGVGYFKDYDNVSGENKTIYQYGSILPETTTRHTASGTAWKFDITSSSANSSSPLSFEIGKVIVAASSLVTISVWMYRTNTNVLGQLRIQKNPEIGVNADVKATNSSASNSTWTQISATCTPTAAGVLTIFLEGYYSNGTGNVILDDMGVSQA